jgi:hypothetical protein
VNASSLGARLAACSWSLQPATPQELISAVKATGLDRVQLALDPLRGSDDVEWAAFFAALSDVGFPGALCSEREAGTTRVDDIAAARKLVEGLQ